MCVYTLQYTIYILIFHVPTYHFISDHDNDMYILFPDHLPEVSTGLLQRSLGHDVVVILVVDFKLIVYDRKGVYTYAVQSV